MNDVDWKLISTLYDNPNITRTADILYTTQPTVSKRLQQIEEEFGVQIVIRSSRGVSFTPEGEFIALEAKKLLHQVAAMKEDVMRISNGRTGAIKLGITNSMGRYILPSLLHKYKDQFPGVNFNISTDISSAVVAMVESRAVHIGFIRGSSYNNLEKHLLFVSQATVACKNKIKLKDLPSLSQIQYISDAYSLKLIKNWWHDHFSKPSTIGMQVNHGDTCREMISNGHGYGIFLSPEFIEDSSELFKLPLFYKNGTRFVRKNWMIWHKDSYEIPLVKNFITYMQKSI